MNIFKFNKQFLIFLFQYVGFGICNLIDTGFGNQIDIDSICVLSAYTVITWVTYAGYSVGCYAYRAVLSEGKACLYIQIAVSIILGILLYLLSPIIPRIYSLTVNQCVLFEKCLKIHAVSLPLSAIGDFLNNYSLYLCKNKISITGNIIFYSIMFITDALVVFCHGTLIHIMWFTVISWLIYDIYMIIVSGILREKYVFNLKEIKVLLKYGSDICFDRLTGKVATVVFNIFASKLDTYFYSIHAVCYSLGTFTENFTNALFTYTVVSIADTSSGVDKFNHCKVILKKHFLFCIVSSYFVCCILLLFIHGDVKLSDCWFWMFLYCSQIFVLVLYEVMKGYLTSEQQTKYLRWGGIIGIVVRVPITVGGYYLGFGLLPFAIGSAVDFLIRGLYFYICSRIVVSKKLITTNYY